MRTLLALLLLFLVASADEISGAVVDGNSNPVAGVQVRLEAGWTRYDLPGFDGWYGVETKKETTGDDGRFTFADLPAGTVATVLVSAGAGVGWAKGTKNLEVKLGPPGSVRGKVLGKRQELKGLRVWVRGGMWLGSGEGTVDKKTGVYEVHGLMPGTVRVHIKANNFDVAVRDVEVAAGKTAKVKSVRFSGKFLAPRGPLVDCLKAKLIDLDGKPVRDVQLVWSSRWMDGGMSSDREGIVKLAGGGVAIGGPPYVLRIRSLRGKERVYSGVLRKIKRGTAIVELRPLHAIRGTVKRGDAAVERYRVAVVGPGAKPLLFWGTVKDGEYTVHVPPGPCRFVIGTADGRLHDRAVDVKGGATRNFKLE